MDPSHPVAAGSRAGLLPELPEGVAVPEDVAEETRCALAGCGLFTMFRIEIAAAQRLTDVMASSAGFCFIEPTGLAFDSSHIWVTNFAGNSVSTLPAG